jgi:chemotaxis protein methyltransferase CheR
LGIPVYMLGVGEEMNVAGFDNQQDGSEGGDPGLDLLLKQLMEDLGLNLKQYKPNYLKRRIGVRMRATGSSDYLQYHQCVRRDPEESQRLVNDLTINVTEFFRDQDVYEAIRSKVIPEILEYKTVCGTPSLRAWSAGCATGEEPYSISILFQDALKRRKGPERWAVNITATDLDDKVIQKAKAGIYEEVKLLPGIALSEYFFQGKDQYLVREEVKRPVRFMLLDIVKPPPLRHLDLILCRNVLIYFEREKQHKILEIFNHCLRKGGFLVLGKSEAIIGQGDSGFVPFNRKERVYIKEGDSREVTRSRSPRK